MGAQAGGSEAALRKSVVFKVVQSLRHAERRKAVMMVKKRMGMCVWAAAVGFTLHAADPRCTPG